MKKLTGLTLAVMLLATGSAEARASASYDGQGLAAGVALMSTASNTATFEGDQGFCKPFKRNRARCGEKITATLLDGTPIRCWVQIVVSKRWWHFPPERFGCPVEWRPTA